ncbi:hypothetical protein CYMTET_5937 [Cymbomonas tetramitiformis]|uniref:Uncharacterized protein n=1 Tax=Cymbomonas tetramitiformis TaxID=36881 RepID=A0AAE0LIK9_9CHLO|nr:hypothetical protein CYMTET_5937 [Cymbomonas tetramitiformis]
MKGCKQVKDLHLVIQVHVLTVCAISIKVMSHKLFVYAYPCDSFGTPKPQETALCTHAGDQRIQHTLWDTHPDSPELTSEEWDPLSLAEPPEPLCICTASALPPCA